MSIKPLTTSFLHEKPSSHATKISGRKNDTPSVSKKSTEKTAETVKVDLKNKPKGTNAGEYLLREALTKVSSKYGFNSSDVELEIVTRQQNKTGFSLNHDNYTDEQIAKDIKTGNPKIDYSIPESMIAKIKERKEILKVIAEKEAFGGNLSEKDISELSELGYNTQDISNLRNVKMMEYGGHQAEFVQKNKEQFQNLNNELRQKMVNDELSKLQSKPDEDFYNEGNEKINPDFERRRVANEIVNKELNGKTPVEYLQNKRETDAFAKRLEGKSYGDYAGNQLKNTLNGLYGGIGDLGKGTAVTASQNNVSLDGKTSEVKDSPLYKGSDWLQQNTNLPTDKDLDKTFWGGTLPKTIGGLLPAVLGAWVTKNPQATVAVYSGLSTGGAVYDEAIANHATETQAQKTALLTGGFVGITSTMGYGKTLMSYEKTLEALNKGAGSKVWQKVFSEAVKDGGRNAVVAGGQTIGENAIAKTIYDKNRGYLDNIEQRMIAAGITGTALKGGLEIIGKVKAGKNPQVLAKTQRVFNIKPTTEVKVSPKVVELNSQAAATKAKLNAKIESSKNNKVNLNVRNHYDGKYPPDAPTGKKPSFSESGAADYRYQRYVYEKYLKGAKATEILSRNEWEKTYFTTAKEGGRPGRAGGASQVSTRKLLESEGFVNTENTKLGSRTINGKTTDNLVDMYRSNKKGGIDYVEVDEILKNGLPKAMLRVKLKAEISALKQNDRLIYIDKTDSSRRIEYNNKDNPNVVDSKKTDKPKTNSAIKNNKE